MAEINPNSSIEKGSDGSERFENEIEPFVNGSGFTSQNTLID